LNENVNETVIDVTPAAGNAKAIRNYVETGKGPLEEVEEDGYYGDNESLSGARHPVLGRIGGDLARRC
jgi:hypothetical protein